MLWATRLFDLCQGSDIEELFADQYAASGRPKDMMLIEVRNEVGRRRLYVGAPGPELLSCYYGFASCLRRDLPKAPTLIAGNQAVFQAMFSAG